jgi:hypothetical protein
LELEVPTIAPGLEQTSQLALSPALLSEWSLEESSCFLETRIFFITTQRKDQSGILLKSLGFGLCPSSGILENYRIHTLETTSASALG